MSDTAGWQPDPTGKHDHRYWDGSRWTENVADAGVASVDPYVDGTGGVPGPDEPTAVTSVPEGDTASYPTAGAPPPYVPPSPVADGGGGGASKRGLVIGGAILAAVVIAVIAFLALDGDDDEPTDPLADRSTETTQADGDDRGEDTETDEADELPDELSDDLSGDELQDIISQAYEEAFGISEEKADCLAERISGAVEDGVLDEEQAMSEIFGYLADCDISMEEISGNQAD